MSLCAGTLYFRCSFSVKCSVKMCLHYSLLSSTMFTQLIQCLHFPHYIRSTRSLRARTRKPNHLAVYRGFMQGHWHWWLGTSMRTDTSKPKFNPIHPANPTNLTDPTNSTNPANRATRATRPTLMTLLTPLILLTLLTLLQTRRSGLRPTGMLSGR
jgi:hypothetical protein